MPRPVDRAQAEAAADAGGVAGLLAGQRVRVKPFPQWTTAATRAQRLADYETWAQECLVGDDYRIWLAVNPTNQQALDFFNSWSEQSGQDMGESQAS